jgi:hypothetical protein
MQGPSRWSLFLKESRHVQLVLEALDLGARLDECPGVWGECAERHNNLRLIHPSGGKVCRRKVRVKLCSAHIGEC